MGEFTFQQYVEYYGEEPGPGEYLVDPREIADERRQEIKDGLLCALCHGHGVLRNGVDDPPCPECSHG